VFGTFIVKGVLNGQSLMAMDSSVVWGDDTMGDWSVVWGDSTVLASGAVGALSDDDWDE
jgi:hypothetical protein